MENLTISGVRSLIVGPPGSVLDIRLLRGGSSMLVVRLVRSAAAENSMSAVGAVRRTPSKDGSILGGVGAPTELQSGHRGGVAGLGFTVSRDGVSGQWIVRRLKEGGFAERCRMIHSGVCVRACACVHLCARVSCN